MLDRVRQVGDRLDQTVVGGELDREVLDHEERLVRLGAGVVLRLGLVVVEHLGHTSLTLGSMTL